MAVALWACAAAPAPSHSAPEGRESIPRLPLLRAGRSLHFRGYSKTDISQPNLAPAPQVGYLLSRLLIKEVDGHGGFTLEEENALYSAEGNSLSRLGTPRDRRTRLIHINPAEGRVRMEFQITRPPAGSRSRARALTVRTTDDGLGLNAAARSAAGLATLVLPPATFAALAAGETVVHDFDFWLVKGSPGEDLGIVAAEPQPAPPPADARGRVRGHTEYRPLGREPFRVTWRQTLPPADVAMEAPVQQPDEQVELSALAVAVKMDLTVEWRPGPDGKRARGLARHDRMTWTILDSVDEPLILASDGTLELEIGEGAGSSSRKAYMFRRLDRVEEGSP
ncbi:MAG: hypothetical protein E2P00_03585 [Acidobacteria bacterium]|nr:MAG: hypothetical protein E2P00_03585 [Acidobacteriota bacterium]